MPNFTTPIPPKLTGNTELDISLLKEWGTSLIDELSYLFNNLDTKNVIEASSVKAEHIDTNSAKIRDAQIGNLNADKLICGSVDTSKVNVKDENGNLSITGSKITISDSENERFSASYSPYTDKFNFTLYNEYGSPTVNIGSDGNAVFSGELNSSTIFSSKIIGTDKGSYEDFIGDTFADIDKSGIKIMQDKNGTRYQKVGISASDSGEALIVLGAGNGSNECTINDITYTDGTFMIEKHDSGAQIGIIGSNPFISFWEGNGELWLDGRKVKINGHDVVSEISELQRTVSELRARIH